MGSTRGGWRELLSKSNEGQKKLLTGLAVKSRRIYSALSCVSLRSPRLILSAQTYRPSEWSCKPAWILYRRSEQANLLKEFLQRVAPNSLKTSTSEYTPFRGTPRQRNPGSSGYHEIRTLYFSHMSSDQRASVERFLMISKYPSDSPEQPRESSWCWLRGFRHYEGQTGTCREMGL